MGQNYTTSMAKMKQRARMLKLAVYFFAALGLGTTLCLVFVSIYVLAFADEIFRSRSIDVFPIADGTALYDDMKQIEIDKNQALEEILLQEKLNSARNDKSMKQRVSPVDL